MRYFEKYINIQFNCLSAYDFGETEHPEKVIAKLGIEYFHATPQPIVDSWVFWGCRYVPNPLPPYIHIFNNDPKDMIGYGLDEVLANEIIRICTLTVGGSNQ